MSAEEERLFNQLDFSKESYQATLGVPKLKADNTNDLLSQRWCRPSLSIVGIENSGHGGSVISKSVVGKISIRYVPDQKGEDLLVRFTDFVNKTFNQLNSGNSVEVRVIRTGDWWLGDRSNKYYKFAAQAIQEEWGVPPMYVREGGTIPVTPFLEQTLGAPALLLPLGTSSDRAHLENERIGLENLLKGKNVIKRLFRSLAEKGKD